MHYKDNCCMRPHDLPPSAAPGGDPAVSRDAKRNTEIIVLSYPALAGGMVLVEAGQRFCNKRQAQCLRSGNLQKRIVPHSETSTRLSVVIAVLRVPPLRTSDRSIETCRIGMQPSDCRQESSIASVRLVNSDIGI